MPGDVLGGEGEPECCLGVVVVELRKSGKQVAARKAAREKAIGQAAAFRQRQEQLEELAAEVFVITNGIDTIEADTEEQVSALRAAAQTSIASERTRANAVVWKMLDTHVPRKQVAERLGIPLRDVKPAKPDTATMRDRTNRGRHHNGSTLLRTPALPRAERVRLSRELRAAFRDHGWDGEALRACRTGIPVGTPTLW